MPFPGTSGRIYNKIRSTVHFLYFLLFDEIGNFKLSIRYWQYLPILNCQFRGHTVETNYKNLKFSKNRVKIRLHFLKNWNFCIFSSMWSMDFVTWTLLPGLCYLDFVTWTLLPVSKCTSNWSFSCWDPIS